MSAEVAAALIAAIIAFVGLIITKEQKTTEFRQDWINSQRADLALMMAYSRNASGLEAKELAEAALRFDEAHGRVRLRENPKCPEWSIVLDALDRLRSEAFSTRAFDVSPTNDWIVEMSQINLKKEWDRVKGGEFWFRHARWAVPTSGLIVWLVGTGILSNG
jgi:hypothetical protein